MARAYIKGWAKSRKQVIERAGGLCERCGVDIKLTGNRGEVNHIKSLADGGDPIALENLELLCRGCHLPHSVEVVKRLAKTKRVAAKHKGEYVKIWRKKIPSRLFPQTQRPLGGWPKR